LESLSNKLVISDEQANDDFQELIVLNSEFSNTLFCECMGIGFDQISPLIIDLSHDIEKFLKDETKISEFGFEELVNSFPWNDLIENLKNLTLAGSGCASCIKNLDKRYLLKYICNFKGVKNDF
jgi:hypothetical protein